MISQITNNPRSILDGANRSKANKGSGLDISPWAAINNLDGNIDIHGKTKATQLNIDVKWKDNFGIHNDIFNGVKIK